MLMTKTGPVCARGLANILTMASFNIVTDISLIILPFPMLRNVRLNWKKYRAARNQHHAC